jgi:hypothetical protein
MLLFDVIAAGIHPTLSAMVGVLSLALVLRVALARAVRPLEAVGWAAAAFGVTVGTFALFGYFGVHDRAGRDFGRFSADLLALVNPAGVSHWLPDLPRGPGQYEGFGYLGLAVMVLLAAGVWGGVLARRREDRAAMPRLWPLVVACAAMAVFSLSNKVTWAGKEVLSLGWLYRPVEDFVEAFRSSGRFVWPLHYLLIALGLYGVLRGFARWPRALTAGLSLVVLAQLLELGHGWNPRFEDEPEWGRFRSPQWALARGHYDALALYPEVFFNGDWRGCTSDFTYQDVMVAGDQAYRLGLSFNSMYVSRSNWDQMVGQCEAFNRSVQAGRFEATTIYLIAPRHLPELRRFAPKLACAVLDRHVACVRADNTDPFRDALAGPGRAARAP